MDIGTLITIGIALLMVVIGVMRGRETLVSGLQGSWNAAVGLLPLLLAIFIIVGFADVLLPRELITSWLGEGSGWKGILIACGVGAITPGGPFVSYPLVATLYRAGASVATVVAFVTAWSLWSLTRLPIELSVVGFRLTAIRFGVTLLFPPLAGFITEVVMRLFKV